MKCFGSMNLVSWGKKTNKLHHHISRRVQRVGERSVLYTGNYAMSKGVTTIYWHVTSSEWIDANLCGRLLELSIHPDFVIFHFFAMLHGLLVILLQTVDLLMTKNLLIFKIVHLETKCESCFKNKWQKWQTFRACSNLFHSDDTDFCMLSYSSFWCFKTGAFDSTSCTIPSNWSFILLVFCFSSWSCVWQSIYALYS